MPQLVHLGASHRVERLDGHMLLVTWLPAGDVTHDAMGGALRALDVEGRRAHGVVWDLRVVAAPEELAHLSAEQRYRMVTGFQRAAFVVPTSVARRQVTRLVEVDRTAWLVRVLTDLDAAVAHVRAGVLPT